MTKPDDMVATETNRYRANNLCPPREITNREASGPGEARLDALTSLPGVGIPKFIHQTFPTSSLPEPLARNAAALRARNPGYGYRLYTDTDVEDFIRTEYGPHLFRVFSSINPAYGAARADLFRYLLMYRRGGVYLDMKSSADKPLDQVLCPEDEFIISQWDNGPGQAHEGWGLHKDCASVPGGEFQQWHIICSPGHAFLRAVIEKVVKNINQYRPWRADQGWLATLRTTGPIAYTSAISPLLSEHPHRKLKSHRELGLKYSIFGDQTFHRRLTNNHYKTNQTPVVLPPGIAGAVFRSYAAMSLCGSALRRKLRPRAGCGGMPETGKGLD